MTTTDPKQKALSCLPLLGGGLICFCFLLILYAVKGFFPFGSESIAIMDMCHGYIPMYYHLYDFLHGSKSLFFDFYSGIGVNMVGIAAVNGLLSPFNLLFYLTSRAGLVHFINILLILKIVAAALTSQFFFVKRFRNLPAVYATAFSVLYALSGYVLLYYMHIIWLDVVVLFPLLLYFGEKMLHNGKVFPYTLCLALTLICSFYLGVMALMIVFFIGGAYVFILMKKEDRPSAAVKLGVGTAVGGLLPMFLMLPGYFQMRSSARYGGYQSGLSELLGGGSELNLYKTWMFFGLQLAFVFVILLIAGYKKHPKQSRFAAVTLFLLLIPSVVEGSAALLHFGSYKDFPYRFGFAAIFMILALAALQINENGEIPVRPAQDKNMRIASYLIAVSMVIGFFVLLKHSVASFGCSIGGLSENVTALLFSLGSALFGILMFFLILRLENPKIRRLAALVLCVVQLFPFALMTVGSGSSLRSERVEHDTEYIEPSLQVGALATTDNTKLERIHNPDMSLNINYGFVAGRSALSNWTHQIPASLQNLTKSLGYSTTYTLLLDGGGTVFSDAVLNMKQTVAKTQPDENLYSPASQSGDFKIYDNLYTLPVGMLCDESLLTVQPVTALAGNSTAVFENQNQLFRALGGSGNLIRTIDNDPSVMLNKDENDSSVTYKLQAGANEVLYFTSLSSAWNSMEISVNGKKITVPSYHKEEQNGYSSEYNNNCIELGTFDRKTVTVRIDLIGNGAAKNDFAFGFLSLNKMQTLAEQHEQDTSSLCAEKNRIVISCNNTSGSDRYILIPVGYDRGWQCKVNGENAQVLSVAGGLMSVRIPAGVCTVKLSFTPNGLWLGLLLTLIGTVLFGLLIWADRKHKKNALFAVCDRMVCYVFSVLWLGGIFVIYILPIGYSIANIFLK